MEMLSKKRDKWIALQEAAYELFTNKGVPKTSIDDIVKRANVAKGTFYLYFKDKYDLLDRLVLQKSAALSAGALAALDEALAQESMAFEDRVIFFIDYVVQHLKQDNKLLSVLHKNLIDGLLFRDAVDQEIAGDAIARFTADFVAAGATEVQARQTLYIILEMVGSVCYSTIIDNRPCSIDEITPTLYQMVRKLLRP